MAAKDPQNCPKHLQIFTELPRGSTELEGFNSTSTGTTSSQVQPVQGLGQVPDKVYCFGRGGPGIFFGLAWLEAVGNRICCRSNILRAADTVKNLSLLQLPPEATYASRLKAFEWLF